MSAVCWLEKHFGRLHGLGEGWWWKMTVPKRCECSQGSSHSCSVMAPAQDEFATVAPGSCGLKWVITVLHSQISHKFPQMDAPKASAWINIKPVWQLGLSIPGSMCTPVNTSCSWCTADGPGSWTLKVVDALHKSFSGTKKKKRHILEGCTFGDDITERLLQQKIQKHWKHPQIFLSLSSFSRACKPLTLLLGCVRV